MATIIITAAITASILILANEIIDDIVEKITQLNKEKKTND